MDNLVVDEVPASDESTPTVLRVNSEVAETCNNQPPPPGTGDIEIFHDAAENSKIACESETVEITESKSTEILNKSVDLNSANVSNLVDVSNLTNVSMELVNSSSSERNVLNSESLPAVKVSNIDSICSSQVDVTNSSKVVENKTTATLNQNSEITKKPSEKAQTIESSKSSASKISETIPKNVPQPCVEIQNSVRLISKRRSRKERSISHSPPRKFSRSRSISRSPRRKVFRSRSPPRFRASSKSEKRNYRRYSRSSSSSPSPRKYRSRSPSCRKRRSYSSYSSSSASSPRRGRQKSSKPIRSRSTEKRYSRGSYEYCEVVEEMKYGNRSNFRRTRERSSSPSPKNRRPSKRKSHSTSPKGRLRRMMAHETLSKIADGRFSSQDCDNRGGGQREVARVNREVQAEVKSTRNSEKLSENDQMNVLQKKIRVIKKRLRHERREFRKRPESYPTFADEWKMFWANRFKQIKAAGKEDPHNYDYRPDWTQYWLVRIKQIYKEKYKKLKSELKEDLGISSDKKNENVINSEVVIISDGQESASPWEEESKEKLAEPKADDPKSKINNDKKSSAAKLESKEDNSAANTLSTTAMQQQSNFSTQSVSASTSSSPSQNLTPSIVSASNLKDSQHASSSLMKSEDSIDINLRDEISIISVLRQLSVLETQLGSQATLIINLLVNGLAREKKLAGSSIELLTHENRVSLDLIREKLIGQLQLEVVPDTMIKATKRCIKSIDDLMRVVPEPKPLDLPRVAESKSLDPRLSRIPASSSSSTAYVSFNPRNNFSSSTCSMPSVYPMAVAHSNASARITPQPTTSVQAYAAQYPVSYESYVRSVPYGTSPGTRYSTNSVNSTNQMSSPAGLAAAAPIMTPRQSISNRTISAPKTVVAHSNQSTLVSGVPVPVQSKSTGASSATSYFRSTAACASDPRIALAASSNRPQIPLVSSSTQSQLPSSNSSASHSRTIPVNSSIANLQAVPATSSFSDSLKTSVNLPSNGSGLPSMLSTLNEVGSTPITSASCNHFVSTENSVASNTSITLPSTGSRVIPSSSSATVVGSCSTNAPAPAVGPIIDLTDDTPDYDESNEPINRLTEARIIEMLKNFRQLPRLRQQQLVDFLRELEKTDLQVVENLKKYVPLPFNK